MRKITIFSIMLFIMIGSLVQGETETFTLEVLPVKGSGTVNMEAGKYQFQAGSEIELKAESADGWCFVNWQAYFGESQLEEATLVIKKDMTIQPVFVENRKVRFPDNNLDTCIRELIEKPTGQLYLADVIAIKKIKAEGKEIESLEGLENLSNLQLLYLGRDWDNNTVNYIKDLTPLAELDNLLILEAQYNMISDISPIKNLINLSTLNISSNNLNSPELKISDISAVKNMDKLYYFNLAINNVSDISVLSDKKNLQYLDFAGNPVSDISPLKDLKKLKSIAMHGDKISDISSIKGLTNLTHLNFMDNSVADISILSGMKQLQYLNFMSNKIQDISVLQGLPALKAIYMYDNRITDITPLVENENIKDGVYINIQENPLDLSEDSISREQLEILKERGVIFAE